MKYKATLFFLFIIISITNSFASDYYWVGGFSTWQDPGTGNWSEPGNWATTSGGTTLHTEPPGETDNVFFDENSFPEAGATVNINTHASCLNMDWTGAANNPKLSGHTTTNLNIYGSLTLIEEMDYEFAGHVYFLSFEEGRTIETAGQTFGRSVFFNNPGGWTLLDDLAVENSFGFSRGTLNTNGKTINASTLGISGSLTRSLDLGNSEIILSGSSIVVNPSNLTLDAGTSRIRILGDNPYLDIYSGGEISLFEVFFEGEGNQSLWTGSNTFIHYLKYSGSGRIQGANNSFGTLELSPGHLYRFSTNVSFIITDELIANGSCALPINLQSSHEGSVATIYKDGGDINLDYVIIRDLHADGSADFIASNSIDMGNNDGWTINERDPEDLYWVGGDGYWHDADNWATSSGGAGGSCIPAKIDNVFFDANSFTTGNQVVLVDSDIYEYVHLRNMNWTGATNTPALQGDEDHTFMIHGSMILISDMDYGFDGELHFITAEEGRSVVSGGQTLKNDVYFYARAGSGETYGGWNLGDELDVGDNTLYFVQGTINTNNHDVFVNTFDTDYNNPRNLYLGASTLTLSRNGGNALNIDGRNLELDAGTSLIKFTGETTWDNILYNETGGGLTFHDVLFDNPGSGGGRIRAQDGTFNHVEFRGDGYVWHSNTFNKLTFAPGKEYIIRSGQTQTITNDFVANGEETAYIIMKSSSSGSHATFSKDEGEVTVEFVSLQDIHAAGGADFIANQSFDLGNNDGWTINAPDGRTLYWVGGEGNWNEAENWSLESGGDGGDGVPTQIDDVVFDAYSFSEEGQTITLIGDASGNINCRDMDWSAVTNNPVMAGGHSWSEHLYIHGSLALSPDMTYDFLGQVYFVAEEGVHTINTAGVELNIASVYLQGEGGEWSLESDLDLGSQVLYLVYGTLNTNDHNISADRFISNSNGNQRTLNLGASEIHLYGTGTGTSGAINFHDNGLELNAGTSTIIFKGTGGALYNRYNGNLAFHDVVFEGSGNQSIWSPSSSFNDIVFHGNGTITGGGNTIENLTFHGNGTLNGDNTIGSLTFSAGKRYDISGNTTQTIVNDFVANGNPAGIIIIQTSWNESTFFKESGSVTLEYVSLENIHAEGDADFVANNALDLGNNEGWTINALPTRDFYWVGGTGNWNEPANWSLESGGDAGDGVPTRVDNVYFDENSFDEPGQTLTLIGDALNNISFRDMDWSAVTNNPVMAGANNLSLRIFGSLILAEEMTYAFNGYINFEAEEGSHVVNAAGHKLDKRNMSFQGEGGEWTLESDLDLGNQILYFVHGTLNTNDYNVHALQFYSYNSTNERVLNLGSSVITLTRSSTTTIWQSAWYVHNDHLELNAGTSTIRLTGWNSRFYNRYGGENVTYHNVVFEGSGANRLNATDRTFNEVSFAGTGRIEFGNTFENLTFNGNGDIFSDNTFGSLTFSAGKEYSIAIGTTQYITDALHAEGNENEYVIIRSRSEGSEATFSSEQASISVSYATLRDVHAAGGADFVANNSISLGNTDGWTIHLPDGDDYYWVGGTGNWNDPEMWASESGGAGGAGVPGIIDNVFFDENSFTGNGQTVTLQGDASNRVNFRDMDWTGISYFVNLDGHSSLSMYVYGSLTLAPNMDVNFAGELHFAATDEGNTITTAGNILNNSSNDIFFRGEGGEYLLTDDLNIGNNDLTLLRGTLNTGNNQITAGRFLSTNTNERSLILGSSTIALTYSHTSNAAFNVNETNLELDAGTSLIRLTGTNASFGVAWGSGSEVIYHDVIFEGNGQQTLTSRDNNSFNTVSFTGSGEQYLHAYENSTFEHVSFHGDAEVRYGAMIGTLVLHGDAYIRNDNTFGTLTLYPGNEYRFENGATQIIENELHIDGTEAAPITMRANSTWGGSSQAILSKSEGLVSGSYLKIQNMSATGGATFIALNSEDQGDNLGWVFIDNFDAGCPEAMEVCESAEPFALDMATPSGGIYEGIGVYFDDDNEVYMFDAALVEDESVIITYIATGDEPSMCDFTIHLVQPLEVICPDNMVVCEGGDFISLPDAQGQYSYDGSVITGWNPNESGIFEIIYTEYNACGPSTCTLTIEVKPLPEILCGDVLYFSMSEGLIDLTQFVSPEGGWFEGDYLIDDDGFGFDPQSGLDTYEFTYFIEEDECVNHCLLTIVVIDELSVNAVAAPIEICKGSTTSLTAVVSGGTGNPQFAWTSDPPGFLSDEQNPTVSPEVTTTYVIEVTDKNMTASATVSVKVYADSPDPATNMSPADEDYDVSVPVSFSWDEVPGASYYEIYLWRAGLNRPEEPIVEDLTENSYIYDEFMNINYLYHWQVAVYNPCSDEAVFSEIKTFSFQPFADLTPTFIGIPETAWSGQTMDISFTIANHGPGAAKLLSWHDAVYLSKDESFDINTASRVALVKNKEDLQPDADYTSEISLELSHTKEGHYYVYVLADANNRLYETNEDNNLLRSDHTVEIKMSPYPDLEVNNVGSSNSSIIPGEYLSVSWTVENVGDAEAIGGWSQRIAIVSGSRTQILGHVQSDESLGVSERIDLDTTFKVGDYPGLHGDVYLQVRVSPNPELVEKPGATANNTATSDESIILEKRLRLVLDDNTIHEGTATPLNAAVYRSGDRSGELQVNLSVSEGGRITLPETVTIPPNRSGVFFNITAIDNDEIEGDIDVSISASAPPYPDASETLTVIDNDLPSLSIDLSSTDAYEGDFVDVTISRGDFNLSSELYVTLFTDNNKKVDLPAGAIIPAGENLVTFELMVIDNTIPEPTENVRIEATAPGYETAITTLTIHDNDIPELTLVISPSSVSEGAGPYAAWGKLQITEPAPADLRIHVSADQPGEIYFPAVVTIPQGQTAQQFNIGVIDNDIVDGDRDVEITAAVFLPTCGCTASEESGGAESQVLTIIDNDGPSLTVTAKPFAVTEGHENAGSLTISRNIVNGDQLTVNIHNDRPDKISVAETAVIEAGEDHVIVPFSSIDNQEEDGDQIVTITVSSGEYSTGSCWIMVQDRNLPDFVVRRLELSEQTIFADENLEMSLYVLNEGFALGTSGAEVNFYLSASPSHGSNARLIASKRTTAAIAAGDSVLIEAMFTPQDFVGDYYLIATVNENNELNELTSINNTSEAVPISIIPDYTASVSVTGSETVFNGTSPITLSGYTEAVNKGKLPFKNVDVYVIVDGVRRVIQTVSDEQGHFSVDFVPLNGEAGNYSVGACFPGEGLMDAQDHFTILGAGIAKKENIFWDVYLDQPEQGSLEVRNKSDLPLNNIRIEVVSAPPEFSLSSSPIGTLSGNSLANLNYTVGATGITSGNNYREVRLRLVSDEGTVFNFNSWFYGAPQSGNLQLNPVELNKTMVQNQTNYVEFDITNNGNEETGDLLVSLPDVDWMSLAGPSAVPSLAPGEKAVITLKLTPGEDLQLNNPISGHLSVSATQSEDVNLAFVFEPVSLETGDVVIDVIDVYYYNTPEAPHVEGATVILSHPFSGEIIAQGKTGPDGLFSAGGINEGFYNLRVMGPQHDDFRQTIYVEKGITNFELVFITFQAITYHWNVVPTMIRDEYEIELILNFETNVPAPVVIMDMPDTLPSLDHGQVYPFLINMTNHGLITAENVEIDFPDDEEYMFTTNVHQVDILPNSAIQVPVVMQRRSDKVQFDKSSSRRCYDVVYASYEFECGPDGELGFAKKGVTYSDRICTDVRETTESSSTVTDRVQPRTTTESLPPRAKSAGLGQPYEGCDECEVKVLRSAYECLPIPSLMGSIISYFPIISTIDTWWSRIRCANGMIEAIICVGNRKAGKSIKTQKAGQISLDILEENFLVIDQTILTMQKQMTELFGGDHLFEHQDFLYFYELIDPFIQETKEFAFEDKVELQGLLASSDIPAEELNAFFSRWNSTMDAWGQEVYYPNDDYPNIIDRREIDDFFQDMEEYDSYVQERGYGDMANLYNESVEIIESIASDSIYVSVCAQVSIQFSQTLTMAREAFEGTLTLFNGHRTLPMENILLDIEIRDENGALRNNLFEISLVSLDELTGIDGAGLLDAETQGSAVLMFIPKKEAAPLEPHEYSFGGRISFFDPFNFKMHEQVLAPVTIQVNPSPELYIDYFVQRDILGNDPLTDVIEPSIPAEMAVMIQNKGAGDAHGVTIESTKPVIVDNEKGLLIDFDLIGSNLSGQPMKLGMMNIDFGKISAGESSVGQWWFTSDLLGNFISYEISVNHLNSFGDSNLSLINSIKVHELIRSIRVYAEEHDDGINDFLVNSIPDLNNTPNQLYYSNGIVKPVYEAENAVIEGEGLVRSLTVEPSEPGWNYLVLDDPGDGLLDIVSCTRSDGQEIPLDNIWLSHVTLPPGGDPVYENKLHFIDYLTAKSEETYTIVFEPREVNRPEVYAFLGVPDYSTEQAVTSVEVVFNKPIKSETFTYEDVTLSLQGGDNLIDQEVSITQVNDSIFSIDLTDKTNASGYYILTVQTTGITDLHGIEGSVGRQIGWVQSFNVPAVVHFIGLPDSAAEPIDELTLWFNMPIDEQTFTNEQLELKILDGDQLDTEGLTIVAANDIGNIFTISGLLSLTHLEQTYEFTVLLTEISGKNGETGVAEQSVQWEVDKGILLEVNAGGNFTVCVSESGFDLDGSALNYTDFYWSTSGDGVFSDENSLGTFYTLSSDDITAGEVSLCLTANSDFYPYTATDCMVLTIADLPEVLLGDFDPVFENSPIFRLTGGVPSGGVYSGPGITNGWFDPALAGSGTHEITYTYTDNNTGCINDAISNITVEPMSELSLSFGSGFTWFSINLSPSVGKSVNDLFSDLNPRENDRIVSQQGFSIFTGQNWLGNVSDIMPGHSYRMSLYSSQTITVTGSPVEILPISIEPGFYWLGYLPQVCLPVNTALSSINDQVKINDRIISQEGFSMFDGSQWIGGVTNMCPGMGYMINLTESATLLYPDALKDETRVYADQRPLSPIGEYPQRYLQHNMPVLAQLLNHKNEVSIDEEDMIFAYVGDELRGMAHPMAAHDGYVFMSIGSNYKSGEEVRFKAWISELQQLIEVNETIIYDAPEGLGTLEAPLLLTLDIEFGDGSEHEGLYIGSPYPNPFRTETNFPYGTISATQVLLRIFNNHGQVVYESLHNEEVSGYHTIVFESRGLPPGVYHYNFQLQNNEDIILRTGRLVIVR